MAVRTRSQLKSDADTNLADNTAGDISAADVRDTVKNLADSAVLPEDENGRVIDSALVAYLVNENITASIPLDNTKPQIGEGTQIISTSFTPKSATNKLRVTFHGQISATALTNAVAALFVNSGADAVAADYYTLPAASYGGKLAFTCEFTAGSTSAVTLSVRVGTTAGTLRMNGFSTAAALGGTLATTLLIEEIAVRT